MAMGTIGIRDSSKRKAVNAGLHKGASSNIGYVETSSVEVEIWESDT